MKATDLFEIAFAIDGRFEGVERGITAQGASIDSRKVKPGDIFFALPGTRTDGSRFVEDAFRHGAVAAVVSHGADLGGQEFPRSGILRVKDPASALWDLALHIRRSLNLPVVAVTGSCGKTTTRELIYRVLSRNLGPGLRSPASFNNDLGVPLTLLSIERSHTFAVVELGANRPGEIGKLARLVKPRVGVVLNVRTAHLEGFCDLFGVARAKGELFGELPPDGLAVYNPAELGLATLARRARVATLTFGAGPRCTVRLESVACTPEGLSIKMNGVPFRLPVNGARVAWNVAAAAAVGVAFGVDLADAAGALRDFRAPPGRLTQKRCGGVTVIDDAYNANPSSMKAALETVRGFSGANRRILVIGDMLELGKVSLQAHVELGRQAAAVEPDLTISVGRYTPAMAGAMMARGIPPSSILQFEDTDSASSVVPGLLSEGDVVLLKASRALRFEKIREAIETRFPAPVGACS